MTYLYLDDQIDRTLRSYVRAVTHEASALYGDGALAIKAEHPGPYRQRIDDVMGGTYDGVILDLRLDIKPAEGIDEHADYRAPTIAQEIRTRAAENLLDDEKRGAGEFPIVLWSTDERLDESYARDNTSHDLFDLLCIKNHILSQDDFVPEEKRAGGVARRLVSLVEGYAEIQRVRESLGDDEGFYRFLGFEQAPDFLDEDLAGLVPFAAPPLQRPAHEYARFIQRHVLRSAGPLLDRATVAARLGIDAGSSDDFDTLLDRSFSGASYTGPFYAGWPRWWSEPVESAWATLTGREPGELRSMTADERVAGIKGASGLAGLVAAVPTTAGESTEFWVTCQITGRPLDPGDGFVLDAGRRYPWQRDQYVSEDAVRRNLLAERRWRLATSERERARELLSS